MFGNEEKDKNCSGPKKYITCPNCGEQIQMMPSLSQMIEAIEDHLLTHKDRNAFPKNDPIRHPKAPSISEDLTEQVLIRAAEIGDSLGTTPLGNIESEGLRNSTVEEPSCNRLQAK
jgi:hypothetical protein